jgi:peptidyl-dipeptidase Dcp
MTKRHLLALAASALALSPLPLAAQGMGPFAAPSPLPFHAPDFARIKDADFRPAIEQGIALNRAEIEAIANNPAAPSFANTIEAMERSGEALKRVLAVFNALTGANTNDTLDATDSATAPLLAGLSDEISLNAKLFARIKALHDHPGQLSPAQLRLLNRSYDTFAHEGALLDAAGQTRLKAINQRLASLSTDFSQKLTAGTREAALVVSDKAKLAGLSEDEIAAAAKVAEGKKLPAGSYALPLQNTTQQPQLESLTDPATRRALFAASWTRSQRGDANDTRALIAEIAQLRAEKAQLLGFKNFSDYQLYDQMAKNGATARKFMAQLAPALAKTQASQVKEIAALIAKDGGDTSVQPADWAIYAARIQKAKLAFDPAAAKPYFEITKVMEEGVFYAAGQLYGLTFKRRTDLPVYQEDVKVYTVYRDGKELALFYWDPWKRDNKQGGAWMSNFVDQSGMLGTKPVIYNVENFAKPAAGAPQLVTFDDVITMFHEFGHALHGMLSDQYYPGLSGTNTARDFVEFPSQFNENWATHPKVLAHYARHYQTGAPMPAAMVAKLKDLRRVDQGYTLGEVVTAAMLDMDWHALPGDAPRQDVDAFEAKALAGTGLDTAHVPPRYRSSTFRHIWGNGYASAYYAYLWTEMLDHDAYAWFDTHGGLTRANGERFRKLVLSRGSSLDYAAMYRGFTGRDPSVVPMMKARGLAQ